MVTGYFSTLQRRISTVPSFCTIWYTVCVYLFIHVNASQKFQIYCPEPGGNNYRPGYSWHWIWIPLGFPLVLHINVGKSNKSNPNPKFFEIKNLESKSKNFKMFIPWFQISYSIIIQIIMISNSIVYTSIIDYNYERIELNWTQIEHNVR